MPYARDLYKTKLCSLYTQRGYCPRQNCSFAHGESELRKLPGHYDSVGEFRQSPTYRNRSLGREERDRNWPHDHRSPQHDRGHTRSKSPAKRQQSGSLSPQKSPDYKRKDSKKHPDSLEPHLSDVSGPIDEAEDIADKDNDSTWSRSISISSQDSVEEQLKEVYFSNESLLTQKEKLEHSLETKVLETTELSQKIAQLETQLASTHNVCKGLASKTKKFVKVYKGFFRAQEELKKSQTKLMKLVDDINGDNEPKLDMDMEYLDTNITSNKEAVHEIPTNNHANHKLPASHIMARQEINNDVKITSNHLSSKVEQQPKLMENISKPPHKLTTAQERRRALLQKALQQGGLNC